MAEVRVKRQLVGLISDTHGLLRPEAVRRLRGSALIVHAGDVGSAAVLQALRSVAPVIAVRGNIDRGAWTRSLPTTETFQVGEVWVHVVHDLEELSVVPEVAGFRVVVSGHSHQPGIRERAGVLFVNPGSAGPRRFRLPVSLALMDVQGTSIEVKFVTLQP